MSSAESGAPIMPKKIAPVLLPVSCHSYCHSYRSQILFTDRQIMGQLVFLRSNRRNLARNAFGVYSLGKPQVISRLQIEP